MIWLVVIVAAVVAVAEIPALDALRNVALAQQAAVLPFAIMFALAGFVILIAVSIHETTTRGVAMNHADVERYIGRTKFAWFGPAWWRYTIKGRTWGRAFEDEASFRTLKDAWRSGRFWTTPRWRAFGLMGIGAGLMLGGALAAIVVTAPLGLSLIVIGLAVNGMIQVARRFVQT